MQLRFFRLYSAALLIVVFAGSPVSAQGFTNGSFELSGANPSSNPNNFGWIMDAGTCGTNDGIASDGNAFTGASGPGTYAVPRTGLFAGWFGATGCVAGMYQNVTDVLGQTYVIDWWALLAPAYSVNVPNSFQILVNGIPIFNNQINSNSYQELMTGAFVGTGNDQIKFFAQNDNGGTIIDDVTLREVTPEPVTMSMMALGLVSMGGISLRRRRKSIQ